MNVELRDKGYVLIKGLIHPAMASFLYKILLLKHWRRESFRDNHIPTASALANDATTDALLLQLLPRIEEISACHLVPSYSYARVYFHGDTMVRHRDRGSCEVNTSIQVGKHGGDFCLCFAPDARLKLNCGDVAVFLGCEAEHWRERFTGKTMGRCFCIT